MTNKFLYITCMIIFTGFSGNGQSGSVDFSFNPNDVGFGGGVNHEVNRVLVQPDKKIIISGYFLGYNGYSRNYIARLNEDGSLDTSFDPGSGANGYVLASALQPDGKIIIGGYFTSFNGTIRNHIARLNSDGSVDESFDPGNGADNNVYSIAIQPDGRIVIGGNFTAVSAVPVNRIARINSNGTLDESFNSGTGADSDVLNTLIQQDGKTIISGNFTAINGTSRNRIARLNSDGTLDADFDPGTGANSKISTMVLQSDEKLIIGGSFTSFNGTTRKYIARLNSNGTVDGTFNPGNGPNNFVQSAIMQPDGRILIAGNFTTYNGVLRSHLASLNAGGSLDNSFDPGTGANDYLSIVTLQSDGKMIVGGNFSSYNGRKGIHELARLEADGTIDSAFNPGTAADDWVEAIAMQPDGKVIIGGYFLTYNNISRSRIARLNSDGSLDFTFDPGGGANGGVTEIALQPDGKIIIAGAFTNVNGMPRHFIARLNTDGSIDTSFDPNGGPSGGVTTILIQPDGKIIIGGGFTSYAGTTINRIARLNADGSLDNSFNPGSGAGALVLATAHQADGKIIVGGQFTNYVGSGKKYLVRLNTDGSLDNTFNKGVGGDSFPYTISIQDDSKIIIGGLFTSYDGVPKKYITRLNDDGSLDSSFNTGTGPNGPVVSTSLQYGKVTITGVFGLINGTGRNSMARLNPNGSLDNSFVPTGGAANILGAVLQDDNKLVIVGRFTEVGTVGRNRIARICVSPIVTSVVSAKRCNTGTLILAASASNGTLKWYDVANGGISLGSGVSFTTPELSETKTYYVEAFNACGPSERIAVVASVLTIPLITSTIPRQGCNASPITLQATANSGILNWYEDSVGGISVGTGTAFTTPSISSTTTYYVDATNECGTSARLAVTATLLKVNGITNGARCDAGTVILNATAEVGTLIWHNAALNYLGEGPVFTTPVINATTSYFVAAYGNCGYSTFIEVIATVNESPAQPTISGDNSNPSSPILTSSGTSGNQWFRNDVAIKSATEKTYTVSQSGIYKVQVTINGCVSPFSEGLPYIVTGLEHSVSGSVNIYPNPARDDIIIDLTAFEIDKAVMISIKDILGKPISETTGQGGKTIQVDIRNFSSGPYLLLLQQGQNVVYKKFIKTL